MVEYYEEYLCDTKWYYKTSSEAESDQVMVRNTLVNQIDLEYGIKTTSNIYYMDFGRNRGSI